MAMDTNNKLRTAIKALNLILNDRIVVACVTCNAVFLNLKWKEYLPLLHGDLRTPTKWYNDAALHYCQNPAHEILSNRNPQGLNQSFNFTKTWTQQLNWNHLPLLEFQKVVLEMKVQAETLPI